MGVGDVSLKFTETFSMTGIALGTIVAIGGWHVAKAVAPSQLRDRVGGTMISLGEQEGDYGDADGVDDLYQGRPGGPDRRRP